MHVFLHDFGGYPFPLDLSRTLARRGHEVTHAWCSSLDTNPGGRHDRLPSDPPSLRLVPVDLGSPLAKSNYIRRWREERRYGRLLSGLVEQTRPDVVVSANTPLDAQGSIVDSTQRLGIPFVFWVQDLIGMAASTLLPRRLPVLGHAVGRHYVAYEKRLLRRSQAVVPITDDFVPVLASAGIAPSRITTIENWAPIDRLPVRPKDNPWACENGLADCMVFLYTGTMATKHDPDTIVLLAEHMRGRDDVRIVVVSHGPGAEHLEAARASRGLANLVVKGYQDAARLPDVLGAADVLVAILNVDASRFSVPSKVLAYLCASRPLLLAVPEENLASRIVIRERAGLVAPPDDVPAFLGAASTLLDQPALRLELGRNGRRFAETAFDRERIADRFESVLAGARVA